MPRSIPDTSKKNPGTQVIQNQDRRGDPPLRDAIKVMEDYLFNHSTNVCIFSILLKQLVKITLSDVGELLLIHQDGAMSSEIFSSQSKPGAPQKVPSTFIKDLQRFKHWTLNRHHFKTTTMLTGDTLNELDFLDDIPERQCSLIIIPLYIESQIRAFYILKNSQIVHFTQEQCTRIAPLLDAAACAVINQEIRPALIPYSDALPLNNTFLDQLLNTAPIGILMIDSQDKIVLSNQFARNMFASIEKPLFDDTVNYINAKAVSSLLPNYNHMFKWSSLKTLFRPQGRKRQPHFYKNQLARRVDGRDFIVNISIFRFVGPHQTYTTLQIQDVTALQLSACEYRRAVQELNALTHLVPVGIIRIDTEWDCVYANDRWCRMTGLTNEETIGDRWIDALHRHDITKTMESLSRAMSGGQEFQAEFRIVTPFGQTRWVEMQTQTLRDEGGIILGFLATFTDITDRLNYQERLRHVAEYDSLTGLANRYLVLDRLQQAFNNSARDQSNIVLMFLDLDGFKDVNDSFGHDAGDSLLVTVAERLVNTLRLQDTVARLGGDEFVIRLCSSETKHELDHIASKIIEVISAPYRLVNQDIVVTTSIGIATGTAQNSAPGQLLKQADAALYLAKESGRNNYQIFDSNLDRKEKNRIKLLTKLRTALKNDEFFLTYQPQASVANNQVTGVEALLRLRQGNEVLPPDLFIPLLEETGMIREVGQWVIEEACRQLSEWQKADVFPSKGVMSINVSPRQILNDGIVDIIAKACDCYKVKRQDIVIEITESVIMDKPNQVQAIMHKLKDQGLKLALDDFGTGYSSLSYLQKYPFDIVKIDKSFISNLNSNKNDEKITRSIIALAQSLGLQVTAEGVTNKETLKMLNTLGVEHFQGFYLGQPAQPCDHFFDQVPLTAI